jgi:hypothetical protein
MTPDPEAQRRTLLREQDDAIAEHLACPCAAASWRAAEGFGEPLREVEGWATRCGRRRGHAARTGQQLSKLKQLIALRPEGMHASGNP